MTKKRTYAGRSRADRLSLSVRFAALFAFLVSGFAHASAPVGLVDQDNPFLDDPAVRLVLALGSICGDPTDAEHNNSGGACAHCAPCGGGLTAPALPSIYMGGARPIALLPSEQSVLTGALFARGPPSRAPPQ